MAAQFIDTHTHLYDEQFEKDISSTIKNGLEAGVSQFYMPNCDSGTIASMMSLADAYPEVCIPMMGVHPCYIKENFEQELAIAASWLAQRTFAAVGEIGLDYYWDTTYVAEQKKAFDIQMQWAKDHQLPIVIHTRESLSDGIAMVKAQQNGNLSGVFHCFGGTIAEAKQIIDLGFYIGIGGVVTFKNSQLSEVLTQIPLQHIVLETDAPYLAPVPYRGKRNESAYIPLIAEKLSSIYQCSVAEIAAATTLNGKTLYQSS
jgi:TatD DNase family protein